MTAPQLLALIAAALLLQLAFGVGLTMWRRRTGAAAMSSTAVGPSAEQAGAAWKGWRDFTVARRDFEDAARSQCSFYLQPVDGLPLPPFKPGQFLTFELALKQAAASASPAAARPVTRCYSLSDQPDPTHYRVTVKRVLAPPDHPELSPGQSSNHFHDNVRVGDMLRIRAPAGHFFIDPDPDLAAVLIGGGIGITPMMSMLRWCMARQPSRNIHLYYGLRNSQEHAFKPQLEEIAASHPALRLHVVYSRPAPYDLLGRDYRHAGHVDIELLQRTLPPGRHAFFVCGPPVMMKTLVPALVAWGVPPQDLHFEAFGPASVNLKESSAAVLSPTEPIEVRFHRSGRTLTWDGTDPSLLDFAERHGIEVEAGCRSGGCGSCETRLLDGEMHYEHAPDHDVSAGHCLLCVGRPGTPLVLDV